MKEKLQEKNFSFFSHEKCEYFPCHNKVDPTEFNCLFCYCPLYPLERQCGGDFQYSDKGVKDCSNCIVPHRRQNYEHILTRLKKHIN